eukprot:Hpha_TRINITY_DN15765_c1_g5::TRINITY_DN15765_c1_g5_i1::g.39540::m.39540
MVSAAAVGLLAAALGQPVTNCGQFQCPTGYNGYPQASDILCPNGCSLSLCCVAMGCTVDATAVNTINGLLDAVNAQLPGGVSQATLAGCDAVAEPSCGLQCKSGYFATNIPELSCASVNFWKVLGDACQLAVCPLPYPCTSVVCGQDVSRCDTYVESLSYSCGAAEGVTCRPGYTGTARLYCSSAAQWIVEGCTESQCGDYPLPSTQGVLPGSQGGCQVVNGVVTAANALRPFSSPRRCSLQCDTGYLGQGDSPFVTCGVNSAGVVSAATSFSCTEYSCLALNLSTISPGIVAGPGDGAIPSCNITNNAIPDGYLTIRTRPMCSIMCADGYTESAPPPTSSPTKTTPTAFPTFSPSTRPPTQNPTKFPTLSPTVTGFRTLAPTSMRPTSNPTNAPTGSPLRRLFLYCTDSSAVPVTTLRCYPNTCSGGLDVSTVRDDNDATSATQGNLALPSLIPSGERLLVGRDAATSVIVPTWGYHCNDTHGYSVCSQNGAGQATVAWLKCVPKSCGALPAGFWSTRGLVDPGEAELQRCNTTLKSNGTGGCAVQCLNGYSATGGICETRVYCRDLSPNDVSPNALATWVVDLACTELSCNIADFDALANHVLAPSQVAVQRCDTVRETNTPCILACDEAAGYTNGAGTAGGGPQLRCTATNCGTTQWSVTYPCVARCTPNPVVSPYPVANTGAQCVNGDPATCTGAELRTDFPVPEKAWAVCASFPGAGSTPTGWFLKSTAPDTRCDPPCGIEGTPPCSDPGVRPAIPATDCTVAKCCLISCSLFSCTVGFSPRLPAESIACEGPLLSDCTVATCCNTKLCTNVPNVTGAFVDCSQAQTHGRTCTITANQGYFCEGTITCTVESSDTSDFIVSTGDASAMCRLAPCPLNAILPGCACDAGYSGVPQWNPAVGWTHTCTPNECISTMVLNSRLYSSSGSLRGFTGDTVTVECNAGYVVSSPFGVSSTTCRASGLFDPISCAPTDCTPTQVAYSDKSAAGSIIGKTGDSVRVNCYQAMSLGGFFVGSGGDGCPGACTTTCRAGTFDTVTCSPVVCPNNFNNNSYPPGVCTCNRGFSTDPPLQDPIFFNGEFIHECHATCGLYNCTAAGFEHLQPPQDYVCPTSDPGSCSMELCCRGAVFSNVQNLRTSEQGASATFTVRLVSRPKLPVLLNFLVRPVEGQLSTNTLVFDSRNFNQDQLVTVTGVNDFIKDGDVTYRIESTVSSSDVNYNQTRYPDILLVNVDDDIAGFVVGPVGGMVLNEAQGQDVITVRLLCQPQATVAVPVNPSETNVVVSTNTLIFSPLNWNVSQTVTVTATPDDVATGTKILNVDLGPAVSDDLEYDAREVLPSVQVTILDDDTPGVIVRPTEGLQTSEAVNVGLAQQFTVRLNSMPTQPVLIPVQSSNINEAKVIGPANSVIQGDQVILEFTDLTWRLDQTVTVIGVDDAVADGNQVYTIQLSAAQSGDPKYDGFKPTDISGVNMDNDTVGFEFCTAGQLCVPCCPSASVNWLYTNETGRMASFTVRLLSQPTAPVTVRFTSSNTREGTVAPEIVVFAPGLLGNWSFPATVYITGANDDYADGDQQYIISGQVVSTDEKYAGYQIPEVVRVTNIDDDPARIEVNPTAGLVTFEATGGAPTNFTVSLSSAPTSEVSLSWAVTPDVGVVTPSTVRFGPQDWSPQLVNVKGKNDFIDSNGDVFYTVYSTGPVTSSSLYGLARVANVTVTNRNDDKAGVTVSKTEILTSEWGMQDTFTVALASEPLNDVSMSITSSDVNEGTVSPNILTFTPVDWSLPKTVVVSGVQDTVQDSIVDGAKLYTINIGSTTSTDPNYSGRTPTALMARNLDDDTPGLRVTPTLGLVVSESRTTAIFTVALTSRPTTDVVVPFSSSDTSEGSVSPTSLRFVPESWNVAQTVTVTGVDDFIQDGNVTFTAMVGTAQSADPKYSRLSAPGDVRCLNMDNDRANFTIVPITDLVTDENGNMARFTAVLTSSPGSAVTLRFYWDESEGRVEPPFLIFNDRNWNSVQTVSVVGIPDYMADGPQPYDIILKPVSADENFSSLVVPPIRIVNEDKDSPGYVVTPQTGLTTTESGLSANFTVSLTSMPTNPVIITFFSSDDKEGDVNPRSLSFSPSLWNVSQTLTVTGRPDQIDDGDQTYQIVASSVTSEDRNYDGTFDKIPPVSVVNTDDDTAEVSVNPTSGLVTTEWGGFAQFSLVLRTKPIADVTVGCASNRVTEGKVTPQQVVFTGQTWDIPQTVTVQGQDDDVQDGNITYTIRVEPATSADPRYNGKTAPSVSVNNTDNDVAGISVTSPLLLQTTEAGGSSTFTIRLHSQPVASVAVSVGVNNVNEGSVSPSVVTFYPGDAEWRPAQTVTVTGVDDAKDDGDITYNVTFAPAVSQDPNYNGRTLNDLEAVNRDDDQPNILVSPISGLVTSESGGTAVFSISLASQPSAPVSVGLVSTNGKEGVVQPPTVTFSVAEWNVPVTATVTGIDDAIADGEQNYLIVTRPAISADATYNLMNAADVSVTNQDNDAPNVIVTPIEGLVTDESGTTASFTFRLGSEPTDTVTLGVSSTDPGEGTVSPERVSFNPSDWNTPKSITVTGVQDNVQDGDITYTIATSAAISGDRKYDGWNPEDVSVTNKDDDTAGIVVEPTAGLVTTEAGGAALATVKLTSEPKADVVVPLGTSDATEGMTIAGQLLFLSSNYDVPQTVTVVGVDDNVFDGNVAYSLLIGPASSADPDYNGLDPLDPPVVNVDNDTTGVRVNPNTGLRTDESGTRALFTVRLESRPDSEVEVRIRSGDSTEGTVSPSSLRFSAGSWNFEKTVTVTGVDDWVDDGDITYPIHIHYNGVPSPDVFVTNTDDDTLGLTFSNVAGLSTTELGPGTNFTVQLSSEPIAGVLVELTSSDPTEGRVVPSEPLLFTAQNWRRPANLSIQGLYDGLSDSSVRYSIGVSVISAADTEYGKLQPASLVVTSEDSLDECMPGGSPYLVCSSVGQWCTDPNTDPRRIGDWMCMCVGAASGSTRGGPATCVNTGACAANAEVCTGAGQACSDQSPLNGWQCMCVPPQVGLSTTGAPATCSLDECKVGGGIVCASSMQTCNDPNTSPGSLDDWVCSCAEPEVGTATAALANCLAKGECSTRASICAAAGQLCDDPDTRQSGDWMCRCKAPAEGQKTGGVADCILDECAVYGEVCRSAGQACSDPNTAADSLTDFMCRCAGTQVTGMAVAMAAECVLDECTSQAGVCRAAGQVCVDRDQTPTSMNDWECQCFAPAVGSAVATVATCAFSGECSSFASICTSGGQSCEDPNPAVVGDWGCVCVPPFDRAFAEGGLAVCLLDECADNGHICRNVGQMCRDPNKEPSSTDDWLCECVAPAVGSAEGEPANCREQGECIVQSSVCNDQGQSCMDPDVTVTGDWLCRCLTPEQGTQVRGPALCTLDECLDRGSTCRKVGQNCVDPDKSPRSLGDWTCVCPSPASGSAVRQQATCLYQGECATTAMICTAGGQTCVDPDTTRVGDWQCLCLSPASGSSTASMATCVLDECAVYGSICAELGQICVDYSTSPDSLGDWRCECTNGMTGSAQARAAVCERDECVTRGKTCYDRGQLCFDTNTAPTSTGDWQCRCPPPASGFALAVPATCVFTGECAASAPTCVSAGQTCVDPDQSITGNWECRCVTPYSGSAVAQSAECNFDECVIHGETCRSVGQTCSDPNTALSSSGDWVCSCAGSSAGSAVGRAAQCVSTGECVQKVGVCTAAGQACFDADSTRTGDWECLCLDPFTGRATAGPAECVYDECTTFSSVCSEAGQRCTDPSTVTTSQGDWQCTCVGSAATGTATAEPARCVLDECVSTGSVCTTAGQRCEDPNTDPSSLNDWTCMCVAPATGSSRGARATCIQVGECVTNAATCITAGQACVDADTTTTGDWRCTCLEPLSGSGLRQPAVCVMDECLVAGDEACRRAGQSCSDPNMEPDSLNDWMCVCPDPAVGSATGKPATCEWQGECQDRASICTAAGQTCVDPDEDTMFDWMCMCVSPQVGSRVGGVVEQCTFDECTLHGHTCNDQGQTCNDPSPDARSTGDWRCLCVPPAVGSMQGRAATCSFQGECVANAALCTSVGQTCVDPNLNVNDDWQCACVAPRTGRATGRQAVCVLDECALYGTICTDAAQTCTDSDQSPGSTGDWVCECIGSGEGSAVAEAAECDYPEACATNGAVCTAAGQACQVPDGATEGDFMCVCVPPQKGSQVRGVATCSADECETNGAVCRASGQLCTDPDPSPESSGDWQCECVTPAIGSARAAEASCTFSGECVANSRICTAAGQTCRDPDPSRNNDWLCVCITPAIGTAVGQPATCQLDECRMYGSVCTAAGQECLDPYPVDSATGDWMCICTGSTARGQAVAKAAECSLDECLAAGSVCSDVGQECVDSNTDPVGLNDWECVCSGGATGSAAARRAQCSEEGECAGTAGNVCTAAGQACSDPDTSRDGDWQCMCVPPQVGTSNTGGAATCRLDECDLFEDTCEQAEQECVDPNTNPTSTGDWFCRCPQPLVGTSTAGVATCAFAGECVSNAVTCTSAGQICRDRNLARSADWECECVPPQRGEPSVGSAAECVLNECQSSGMACREAGQMCSDPNTSPASTGDWICSCVPPAVGQARGGPARCTHQGECVANAGVCELMGQTCVDPSTRSGDWQCVCIPPASGRSTASAASCTLNECHENSAICTAVGQLCVDPDTDPSSVGDWECQCTGLSSSGSRVGGAAQCEWTGECVQRANVCTRAGQTCVDPSTSEGDWTCECISPRTGSATGGVAGCSYDECIEFGTLCTSVGQTCVDRGSSAWSLGDWVCECVLPFSGSATAGPASCVYDECAGMVSICEASGQICEDPDVGRTGDWMCICPPPLSGSQTAGPATCIQDECIAQGSVCRNVGQQCLDTNTASSATGDWQCICVGSATGTASRSAASCVYSGECASNAQICSAAGQACSDPSSLKGDWECECVSPLRGSATGTTATCVLDECSTSLEQCTQFGQTCFDPNTDPAVTGDWQCTCVAPAVGLSTGRAAQCVLDECSLEGRVCLSFGQTCRDASTSPASVGDWSCICAGSATGSAEGAVAACVYEGECAAAGLVCQSAGQSCTDPDPLVPGDWYCACVHPAEGQRMVGGVASCEYDECAHYGTAFCLSAGQSCRDPNKSPTSTGDWACRCGGSSSGTAIAQLAVCVHSGECVTKAAICTAAGQECSDPSNAATDDWECRCLAPAVGSAVRGPATCVLDECIENGAVCTSVGQICSDANTNTLSRGDWQCACTGSDGIGTARARVASCVLDECLTSGQVCSRAGQACLDLNTSPESRSDWECVCAGSSTGRKRGGAAICAHTGECADVATTCTDAGQSCVDPDPTRSGDWHCVCVTPQRGRAMQRAATCVLDECVTRWTVCNAAGQICRDPDKSPTSTGDWVCDCVPPSTGTATASSAMCKSPGECSELSGQCTANGQACEDNDYLRTGDWRCTCVEPQVGSAATVSPARCMLDECTISGRVCTDNGQICVDPNRDPARLGDWRCECPPPASGVAVGRPATCVFVGECSGGPGAICAAAGQGCVDPNSETEGRDWACVCLAPAIGQATAKAAECTLNECDAYGSICAAAGQTCTDPNTAASSTGDWRCVCSGSQGSARARAARCLVDECLSSGSVCHSVGQLCTDPDMSPNSLGDWACSCVGSATGTATGRAATCEGEGECAANKDTCAAAGQACLDPNPTLAGDWRCLCVSPQTGSQQQGPASCLLDECLLRKSVCLDKGQTCRDPDTRASSVNDWVCECGGSSTGSATAGAAECTYSGECVENGDKCAAVSQVCVDATSQAGDWQCACVPPAVGTAMRGGMAQCTLDECLVHGQTCYSAGQLCRDLDTDAASVGDWVCSCTGSGVGSAYARPATCDFSGECAGVSRICTSVGQSCRDPSITAVGDWQCICVAPRSGSATGVPAQCTAAGECTETGSVCAQAGQTCVDPDLTRLGDWQCHCVPPLTGSAVQGVATCETSNVPTPAPAGGPSVVLSLYVSGQSPTALRAERANFVTTSQNALGLASTQPRPWDFTVQTSLAQADFSEAAAKNAVVNVANRDSTVTNRALTSSDLAVTANFGSTGGRRGAKLTTGTLNFALLAGSDAEKQAWLQQIQSQETALVQSPSVRAVPGTMLVSSTAAQIGAQAALTDLLFTDAVGGSNALLRVQQSTGTSGGLLSAVQSAAQQNLQTFRSNGFNVSSPVTVANDCTALTCGTGQSCADSGGPDGEYICTCSSGSGVGFNRMAICSTITPPPTTLSPGGATPAPPTVPTVSPTIKEEDDEDKLLGLDKTLAIILIIIIVVVCLIMLGIILTRRTSDKQPPPPPPPGGPSGSGHDLDASPPPKTSGNLPSTPNETSATPPLPKKQDDGFHMSSPESHTKLQGDTPQYAGGGDVSPVDGTQPLQGASAQSPSQGEYGVNPLQTTPPAATDGGGYLASPDGVLTAAGRGGGGVLAATPTVYSNIGSGRGRGYAASGEDASQTNAALTPLGVGAAGTAATTGTGQSPQQSGRFTSGWV